MPATLRALVFCFSTLFATGCLSDADRGNPLDPMSDNFVDEGRVEGRLTNRSLTGIQAGRVTLSPGGLTAVSDAQGNFSIPGVPSGEYIVSADSPGYAPQLDTVAVSAGQPSVSNFELNGLPVFQSWTVNTAHVSRWWPLEDLFQVEIMVQATDLDGVFDVDRVWLEVPDLAFADTLSATQTTGMFARTIRESELPTSTLHALLGTVMNLHLRDQLSTMVSSSPIQLVRVIDATPEAVEEAFQGDPLDCVATPLIEWQDTFLPFPFTYRVEIIRVDGSIESLVERIDDIPSDSTKATAAALPAGDYYWTVAVVDNFMNRSRSKQVGFCITP